MTETPTGAYRAVTDEDGNPVWQASSEGDGLCPVCAHAPDLHGGCEGCQWHYEDGTHLTEPTSCGCPLAVLLTDDPAPSDGEHAHG
jgi:hypothetical protein